MLQESIHFLIIIPRWIKEMNLAEMKNNPSFQFIEKNILELDWHYLLEWH